MVKEPEDGSADIDNGHSDFTQGQHSNLGIGSSVVEAAALSADRHPRRNIAATRDSLDSDI